MININDRLLQINDNRIMLQHKIKEVMTIQTKVVVLVEPEGEDQYDNVYCYDLRGCLLWRIAVPSVEIGGTARCTYVGLTLNDGKCRAVDFYGRSFLLDLDSGKILSKRIVK